MKTKDAVTNIVKNGNSTDWAKFITGGKKPVADGVNRQGGAGRAIYTDRADVKIDLSAVKRLPGKTPLGTVFYNADLEGVTAYTKCTYTSFALYDKEKGFYYTRLLERVTDKSYLDEMFKLQNRMMGLDWVNAYVGSKFGGGDYFSNARFPWGMIFTDKYGFRVSGRLKKTNPLTFLLEDGVLFGLGDEYLYKIIDLSNFKRNVSAVHEQLKRLDAQGLYVEGDNYVKDKNGEVHPYLGMLTGNYMWLPKGTLYGQQRQRKRVNLYYEMDTCVLLDYETTPAQMTQKQMLAGKPTKFVLQDKYDKKHADKGMQWLLGLFTLGAYNAIRAISEDIRTYADDNYKTMVDYLTKALGRYEINNDLTGNIKFWVRRNEIFLEGQDEFEQSDELKGDATNDKADTKNNSGLPLLALGGLLLSKLK